MEVAPRYTLFTLLTLLTWFTLLTLYTWITLFTWFSLLTWLRLSPQEKVQNGWGAPVHKKWTLLAFFGELAPIASGMVLGAQSSQLGCWEGLFYHFSLNKPLMGLTQSCGKNSDWSVTITQSCGKALIGWSQICKSGGRIFDLSELCHRFE